MNSTKPLFRTASRGVAWSLITSVIVLFASLAAQLVLGWLLTASEYGVYALAYAWSDFLLVSRDGGVYLWLSRLPLARFKRVEVHAFWLATFCSCVAAAVLVPLAFVVGSRFVYADTRITTFILILAFAFPWTAYATVSLAKIHAEMRFRTAAIAKLVFALTRHTSVVVLAYCGWGPLSFAFAFVILITLELIVYSRLTKLRPFRHRPSRSRCAVIFRDSRWSLAGALSSAVLRQSDYAVLGLFASQHIVGLYFFGYKLAMQPVILFCESLRRVIIPTLSGRFENNEDQIKSLALAGTLLGGVASVGLIGLGVTAEPLEALLWRGRWAGAVPVVQFLSLAMPLHLASYVVEMLAQSQGRFRLWTIVVLIRGCGFGLAAWLSCFFGGANDPKVVAIIVAVYIAISAVIKIVVIVRELNASIAPLFQKMLPPYACVFLAAVAALSVQWPSLSPLAGLTIKGGGFVALVALMWGLFSRSTYSDTYAMGRRMLGR